MVLLITAMGGVWTLEQPGGSLLEFYPTWRATMGYIFETGGDYAVLYLVVDIYSSIQFDDHYQISYV